MTTRQTRLLRIATHVLALLACFGLSHGLVLAQTDEQNHLEIDPPPIPRYRKPRPPFVIAADPAVKPLPLPSLRRPVPSDTTETTPKPWIPTPAQLAKRRIRDQQRQQQDTADQVQKDHYFAIAKVVGILLAVGVGIFSVTDIVRQIRKAKQTTLDLHGDEEKDWEP